MSAAPFRSEFARLFAAHFNQQAAVPVPHSVEKRAEIERFLRLNPSKVGQRFSRVPAPVSAPADRFDFDRLASLLAGAVQPLARRHRAGVGT